MSPRGCELSRARFYRAVAQAHLRKHSAPAWLATGTEADDHQAIFREWTKRQHQVITWTPWGAQVFTLFASIIALEAAELPNLPGETIIELYELARLYGVPENTVVKLWRTITATLTALPDRDKARISEVNRILAAKRPAS